ncbi:MAG: hypothetical protein EBZ55_01215, partial [Actinobacteria bacterium]|nr:hypothetical protein [Actinomycetota bacterium]
MQSDQRRRLEAVRLASALAKRGVDSSSVVEATCAIGPAVIADGAGWVVAVEHERHALAVAHLWAESHGVDHLHLVADVNAEVIARRTRYFTRAATVWRYADNVLVEAHRAEH